MRTTQSTALARRDGWKAHHFSFALSLLLAACHAKNGSVDVNAPDDPAHRQNAGMHAADSAAGTAGSDPRGGAGSDAIPDGGVAGADASDTDAGPDPNQLDPTLACNVADEHSLLELPVPFGDEGGFSLTTGLTGFGVAYHAPGSGVLGALPVAALGAFGTPNLLLGDDKTIVDVALLHVSDGWRFAFVDNFSGSAEIQTLLLPNNLAMPGDAARVRVTNNSLREYRPTLADIAGVPQLVWISADLSTGKRQIDRKRFDAQGTIDTLLSADSGHKPVGLAFAQMAHDSAALAFVEEEGAHGIWLLRMDSNSALVGEPSRLTDLVSAGNSVDLATREEDGGAAIYSVDIQNINHEVRFHRLDKTGALLGDEIKIVSSPLQGRDASLARIGGGYVVAYRQLPTGTITKSEIRIAFLTKEGNVTRDSVGRLVTFPVADSGPNGGRVTVRVSTDGELLIAFLDSDIGGTPKLRLVRKRLDCAL